MSRQIDADVREPALADPAAEDARAGRAREAGVCVEGDVEWVGRGLAEALRAVPGEVLQPEERAVRDEHHVQDAVADEHVVGGFDDLLAGSAG